MTAVNRAILVAFEELGMTPEQIAQQEDVDIAAVKAILMQFSSMYRKECKQDDTLNFTDDELVRANQVIINLMQYSEDENLRFRAAQYVRNDKKGRLDVVQQMAGLNVNVLQFNDQMQRALAAMQRAKGEIADKPAIDVEAKELVE